MKIKKIVALALSLSVVCGAAVYAADIPITRGETADKLLRSAAFYNPSVQKEDVIKGYDDGNLHEEREVTRAEALVMLRRAFGTLPLLTGHNKRAAIPKESFTDIPGWANEELDEVFDSGIVAGTEKGIFSPDKNITGDELELFIKRVYSLYGTNYRDDFYATVNHDILNSLEIKPGRTIAGTVFDLADENNERASKIIKEITEKTYDMGTKEQKVSDMYNSITDIEGRNKAGIEPIKPYLQMIEDVKSIDDLSKLQEKLVNEICLIPYMTFGLTVDLKDSTKYIPYFSVFSPGLTKDFYTSSTEEKKNLYIGYIESILSLCGDENAKEKAQKYYDFEKSVALSMMNVEDRNNVDKIYNVLSLDEIQNLMPNVDIEELYRISKLKKEDKILVTDIEQVKKFSELYNEENIDNLKTVAEVSLILGYGACLNHDFTDAANKFNQDFLGISGEYSDDERAAIMVESIMPEYIGQIYVDKYFSEEAKQNALKMVKDIISVYRERIDNLSWMSSETKEKAKNKLDTMKIKIGYPDDMSTYFDNVNIKSVSDGGSYFSNIVEIAKAQLNEILSYQGKPVDKTDWNMAPFTVNACYSATSNDITFPAGILQAPMYDVNASFEENLGGIGYVIAHEITHAFDNNGAKFDENGNAADWWTKEDYDNFTALCENAIKFYDGQESIPGVKMNGKLTLSENVADLGALACITEVAKKYGSSDFKTLYTKVAQSWASTKTREYAEYIATVDLHSDEKIRVNRVLVNLDEFYETFGIKEGDGMYVAPEDRVKIW